MRTGRREVDPVAAVRAAVADRTGTSWIGVDGLGAAGKTTLAARIADALPVPSLCTTTTSPAPV